DVVNGKDRLDASGASDSGDQAGHPVVTVNKVRLNPRDNVVDEFPLKHERGVDIIRALPMIDLVPVIEKAVFRQMNPRVRRGSSSNHTPVTVVEPPSVMGERDMSVRSGLI